MSRRLSVIFYVLPAKNNMSLPRGCETISDLLEISIFHGSSLFFPYHFDNQPVHNGFPANSALREEHAAVQFSTERQSVGLKTTGIIDRFLEKGVY